jgi:hypothetical protein
MTDKEQYERELLDRVVSLFPRPMPAAPRLDIADIARELSAQKLFYTALAEFRSKVQDIILLTDLRKEALTELLAWVDDCVPEERVWNEAINEGRR